MNHIKKLFLLIVIVFCGMRSVAATRTAVSTGAWTNNATWDCNCQPTANDNIVIPPGLTVTVGFPGVDLTGGPLINITVFGTLRLSNAILLVDMDDIITIEPGGQATSSGIGGLVFSGSGPVYVAPGAPITGPATISNGVLPVELVVWNAEAKGGAVWLSWSTASEKNSDFFEVQRSADGEVFEGLSVIPAQGQSTSTCNYSFVDHDPLSGISYYRLAQTDVDGFIQHFEILRIDFAELAKEISIYPNPVVDRTINLDMNFIPTGGEKWVLSNNLGKVMFEGQLRENESRYSLPSSIGAGTYIARFYIDDTVAVQRIVIQ